MTFPLGCRTRPSITSLPGRRSPVPVRAEARSAKEQHDADSELTPGGAARPPEEPLLLTQALARYKVAPHLAARRWLEARALALTGTLDTLATLLAARTAPVVRIARPTAASGSGPAEAPALLLQQLLGTAQAALVNAAWPCAGL